MTNTDGSVLSSIWILPARRRAPSRHLTTRKSCSPITSLCGCVRTRPRQWTLKCHEAQCSSGFPRVDSSGSREIQVERLSNITNVFRKSPVLRAVRLARFGAQIAVSGFPGSAFVRYVDSFAFHTIIPASDAASQISADRSWARRKSDLRPISVQSERPLETLSLLMCCINALCARSSSVMSDFFPIYGPLAQQSEFRGIKSLARDSIFGIRYSRIANE